jgi:hypothetical protein
MSGGFSFYNYPPSDLENYVNEFEAMLTRLQEFGAKHAASDTMAVLQTVRNLCSTDLSALKKVWRAVELYDSADYGEDQVHKALRDYDRVRGVRTPIVPVALPIDELRALLHRLSSSGAERDGDDRLVKTGIERLMAALASTGTVKR